MGEMVSGLALRDAAYRAIEAVRKLSRDIGIPDTLDEIAQIDEQSLEVLTDDALKSHRLVKVNPRTVQREDIKLMYAKLRSPTSC